MMASPEAERLRADLFARRDKPMPSLRDLRRQWAEDAAKNPIAAGTTVKKSRLAGVEAECIAAEARGSGTILYLHGGGYIAGGCGIYRALASRLASAAGARIVVLEYRLAPEYPFPAALNDAIAAYDSMINDGVPPSEIAVAGDSAGGGLAIALLLVLRDRGWKMPAAAMLVSPWTDLTLSGASYQTRANVDYLDRIPSLRRAIGHYVPDGDVRNPLISPIFADLRGLPPMLIQVGDHETLLDDSVRFARRAHTSGVAVELEICPEMWHVWHLWAPELPEANEAIARAGSYLCEQFSRIQGATAD